MEKKVKNLEEEEKDNGLDEETLDEKSDKTTEESEEETEVVEEEKEVEVDQDVVDEVAKAVKSQLIKEKLMPYKSIHIAKTSNSVTKEVGFVRWLKALSEGDFAGAVKVKAAMNETNTSAVIPPTEFIAEVLRLEEEFGVARRFAQVRRT